MMLRLRLRTELNHDEVRFARGLALGRPEVARAKRRVPVCLFLAAVSASENGTSLDQCGPHGLGYCVDFLELRGMEGSFQ